jgi:hypothetical protein
VGELQRDSSAVSPVRVRPWVFIGMSVLSVLLGIGALVRGTAGIHTAADSDLTNFFFPSADYILRGDTLHMYAVSVGGYPNYNPPLSMFLYAPLLAIARAVGFNKNYGELITFVGLPFLLLIPALGALVLVAVRRLHPDASEAQRLMAFGLVVLGPLTWQTIGTWYHLEQPLMLCFLIGALLFLQRRSYEVAGLLAGLALLTRTTAAIPLLALGVLLLLGREWLATVRFGGVAALVTALGLAPFFLAAPNETSYALVRWRGTALIGSDSIWALFAHPQADGSLLARVDSIARRLDMYVVILFVLVAVIFLARRLRVTAYGREAWAVVAIASLAVPMLSKTVWPYYYLEPFALLVVWEYATLHDRVAGLWRWPVLAMGFLAVAATMSQYIWYHSVGPLDRLFVGVTQSGMVAVVALCVWARMSAIKPEAAKPGPAFAARPPGAMGPAPLRNPAAPSPLAPDPFAPVRQPVRPLAQPGQPGGPPPAQPALPRMPFPQPAQPAPGAFPAPNPPGSPGGRAPVWPLVNPPEPGPQPGAPAAFPPLPSFQPIQPAPPAQPGPPAFPQPFQPGAPNPKEQNPWG